MQTRVPKSPKKPSSTSSQIVSRKPILDNAPDDNSANALVQRDMQELAAQSPQTQKLRAAQEMADKNSESNPKLRLPVQAKLKVGASNDPHEHEADKVASQVMQKIQQAVSTPESQVQREKTVVNPNPSAELQSKSLEEEDNQALMKKENDPSGKEGGMVSPELETDILQAKGGGQPLDGGLQEQMGQAMGADFSKVRVHSDGQSDVLNRSVGARAFTTGQDLFFREGEYQPDNADGQELIAHELTHVMQQGGESVRRKPVIGGGLTQILQREGDEEEGGEEEEDEDFSVDVDEMFGENAVKTSLGGSNPEMFDEPETQKTESVGEGTVTTTEKGSKRFVGAGTAARKLVEADDTSLKEAIQALARAGAFGEAQAKKSVETSSGTKASMEGSAKGFAGAEGEAVAARVVDVIEGLTLLARVTGKAGVGFDLEGLMEVSKEVGGVEFAAKMQAKLSGFAGVLAEAKGKININAFGMAAEGKAYAFAGAKSEGEVSMELKAGQLGFDGKAEFEAMAGAEAGAEGKVAIGLEGITVSGKAEAFAGAKVKGGASASLTYQGKILVKISGELEASAGVGGSIEGEFSIKNGKLVISGKLAGALGLGAGAAASVTIDFNTIVDIIGEKIKAAVTEAALDNRSLADDDRKKAEDVTPEQQSKIETELYNAVYNHLLAYGKKKEKLFTSTNFLGRKKADHLVKRENVQEIIDNKIRKNADLGEKVKYKFSDAILVKACMDAFGNQINRGGIIIQAGVIRAFDVKKAL